MRTVPFRLCCAISASGRIASVILSAVVGLLLVPWARNTRQESGRQPFSGTAHAGGVWLAFVFLMSLSQPIISVADRELDREFTFVV